MKITLRVWILIICIVLSLVAILISPTGILFLQKGVIVKSIEANSTFSQQGLGVGMIITQINGNTVSDLKSYHQALSVLDDNVSHKLEIKTKSADIIGIFSKNMTSGLVVSEISSTNLKTGLDIQGGARALITSENHALTDNELNDLIAISQERLNLFGLTDMKLFPQSVLGEKFMVIEIAGSSPSDLQELIAKQGKFEAKIGNETVFVGGNKDVTYVGRTGQDAFISDCFTAQEGEVCNFKFVIYLSEEAAQRHANITQNLEVNISSGSRYLSKTIDFYLDEQLTESLNIGVDLRGKVSTQVQISGSGTGKTRQEAIDAAKADMKKLQTVLITGSLPFKLKIVKIDRISPLLGQEFVQAVLTGGLFAIIAVSIIIFARYRKVKLSLALLLTSFSEIVIILGVAALIKWNLDLPSIAGIIATIGTGVDSQIVILDESRRTNTSLAERIKRALFIIFTSFATAFVSLVPLTGFLGFMGIEAAGGGFLKGFAITTLIGITAGVLITRPAFADIAGKIQEN